MNTYITIDGGTTNTRINLITNRKNIDSIKLNIGAKANIENKDLLKTEIGKAISNLLENNNLCETDVICVLASGMITSEFGLCSLAHINAPAGIEELHNSMEKTQLSDVSNIPFVFIRGVKTISDDFGNTDMMRGEETELMGIINSDYGECIYVLPGSHSKIIRTDKNGRIIEFSTMLTGEMIASLSQQTILKDAVDLNDSEINSEYLLKGYDYCKQEGMNKSLFKVRILKNIFKCDKSQTYSFFVGVVLCEEIEQIIKSAAKTVVLGGRAQIKNAMAEILKNRDNKKVIALDGDAVNLSTSLGAIRIFENNCN